MIQWRKLVGILTSVALLSAGAVVVETRAADQGEKPPASPARSATAPNTAAPIAASAATPANAAQPPKATPTKPPVIGAPQVPEKSATIRDDPTIAPDPKQSADNNVSFPNDI